ncbi:MAG: FAD-dependent oxidoreductase [Rhodospirillaceae bacterium]|jgi:glycine/D-amino acid oxidase-like deaminating enzyme|nr:FAD-dependent oxidoreductase [Rhodospirillaceae bacterium]MBT3491040.1 FAD-dependent oxidoreductase [Rhodospirillaceae bacterium]MBT3781693.1 FAD-dependent oxidoreductase [Rhodospirillaceae bacterium]MBT3975271.1 FAD-dependent oxidoreductase [Rhodospirillaceae bacterium]MBT4170927.1 FAD-dependent oxidoreductase [Rhodospirillaceae bacterium]
MNNADFFVEPVRETPIINDVDVLVCGGGFAGVAAAVAAARNGASVMLVERYGFLGGLATGALVITTPPLNNGINREIARRLMAWQSYAPNSDKENATASDMIDGADSLLPYDPEATKFEFVRMLLDERVEILFHSYIADTLCTDGHIDGVVIENKAGRSGIRAKFIIDATGDADIAAQAGAPVRTVERPITMMFNMAEVDSERALEHLGKWTGLKKFMREAIAKGEIDFDLGVDADFGAPGIFAADLIHKGQLNIWGGMLYSNQSLDPAQRTRAEIVTRDHAFRMANFLKKNLPGFENARLEQMSTEVGIRATRNLDGNDVPSKQEISRGEFKDTIARPYLGKSLAVPYRSLLPKDVDNLLVAGRCISAHDDIMGRLRLIPVCSATGEAAGVAAAMAVAQDITAQAVDIGQLQAQLTEQGVEL